MNDFDILLENLFFEDLKGLVLDTISVDEFESKISDDTIVIGFYVRESDPADDLAIFLERSSVDDVLDTEVSSIPNKAGNFLVFVELINNENIINNILHMAKITTNLTGIKEWKFKNIRKLNKKKYSLTKENLTRYFNANTGPERGQ